MSKNKQPKPVRNIILTFAYDYPPHRALEFKRWLDGHNNTKTTVRNNSKRISGNIRQIFIYAWDTSHLAKALNWLGKGVEFQILNQSLYH